MIPSNKSTIILQPLASNKSDVQLCIPVPTFQFCGEMASSGMALTKQNKIALEDQ